ncbi:hypothetical protein BN140_0926 [Methanoculleus bourgensis MS2]|uniref:Uncharacterized protein n=1 Tax=Methanoculleus bourgensis (strain ATCC 43281 / DSM 3045 / OCM 15 / MS2) TaxID=1201294 RepID=I7LM17_METBM|nr:hypothetical protein BN140_0926 [Methanoculleus bourgensis MS2]
MTAEMGAVFLCAMTGIDVPDTENQAAYQRAGGSGISGTDRRPTCSWRLRMRKRPRTSSPGVVGRRLLFPAAWLGESLCSRWSSRTSSGFFSVSGILDALTRSLRDGCSLPAARIARSTGHARG